MLVQLQYVLQMFLLDREIVPLIPKTPITKYPSTRAIIVKPHFYGSNLFCCIYLFVLFNN